MLINNCVCIYSMFYIMASGPITSWEIDGETVETVSDFIFWAQLCRDPAVGVRNGEEA